MMDPRKLLDCVLREIGSRTGKAPRESGGHWQCRCPAHEDKQASLSVSQGDQGILVKCFAGCTVAAICAAIGMTVKDLFYDDGGSRKARKGRKERQETGGGATKARSHQADEAEELPSPGGDDSTQPGAAVPHTDEPDQDEGCTVAALAEAKGFSPEFLRELGCEDVDRYGIPAVRIPYLLEDGSPAARTRMRVGLTKGRRFVWDGTSEDGDPTLYGLWRLAEARARGTLILVEGESDAWTLWHAGFAALGLPGASMASKIDKQHLAGITRIAIGMEPDKGGETFVKGIADRLDALAWRGIVRVATCGTHKDANALWLATTATANTAEGGCATHDADQTPPPPEIEAPTVTRFAKAFRDRLRRAKPVGAVIERPIELLGADVADLFIREAEECRAFTSQAASGTWDERQLIYHRDLFYEFNGRCYEVITEGELRAWIAGFVRSRTWVNRKGRIERGNATRPLTMNVILNLSSHALAPGHTSPPMWRNGTTATHVLVVKNGLLDVDALLSAWDDERHLGEDARARVAKTLQPHTADLFSTIALPYEWRADATCPLWEAFLDRVLPAAGSREIVQQWAGYCLLPTQWAQKICILHGEGQNGKSVFMALLKRLIGERNCSATPLEFLHLPHMQEPLDGKLLNFSTEWGHIEQGGLNLLKSISGGDPILVNPKNRQPYTTMIYARFIVATNDPPRLSDRTDAIWRRLLTIPFPVTIPTSERRPMEAYVEEMSEELPGILVWALRGLHALKQQGGFVDAPETQALREEYQADANPMMEWCENSLNLRAGEETLSEVLYADYREYCKRAGRHPLKDTSWGKEMVKWLNARTGVKWEKRRVTKMNGARGWAYDGLTLASGDGGCQEEPSWVR